MDHYKTIVNQSKMRKDESDALFDRLMMQKEKFTQEISKKRKDNIQKFMKENTHQPSINKKLNFNSNFKALPERIDDIIEKREKKRTEAKKRHTIAVEEEMTKECTFTPRINHQKL